MSNVFTSRLHFVCITVLMKPLGCCSVRHQILFRPTYGHLEPRPKSSRLHCVGSDGAACRPEQSKHCWRTDGKLDSRIMVRFLRGHYRHCNLPVVKVFPCMCPCKWWTFATPFVSKLLQTINILSFLCVFGSSGFCPWGQIFTVLMLGGR